MSKIARFFHTHNTKAAQCEMCENASYLIDMSNTDE